MIAALYLAMLGFAFLSADAAAFLRFDEMRTVVFTAVVIALVGAAMLRRPTFSLRLKTVPVILVVLLAAIALVDASGTMHLVDYKVILLLVVLLFAPNVAAALTAADPVRITYLALAAYVSITFMLTFVAIPAPNLRGQSEALRWDFTGSLVGHSGLCVIFAVLALGHFFHSSADAPRALHLGLGSIALFMAFMTGTRTVLISLALTGLLAVCASRSPIRAAMQLCVAGIGLLAMLLAHSLLFSGALVMRLLEGSSEDYTSGRWHSQLHWLALASDHQLGLGLGAVRELLRDGRPALGGEQLLEWPHNEFLRFWVEAGPLGLAFIGLLVFWLIARAIRAAAQDQDIRRRLLMAAIAADMLAQSLFQNYFNGIYHATTMVALLIVLIVMSEDSQITAVDSMPDVVPERPSGIAGLAEPGASR